MMTLACAPGKKTKRSCLKETRDTQPPKPKKKMDQDPNYSSTPQPRSFRTEVTATPTLETPHLFRSSNPIARQLKFSSRILANPISGRLRRKPAGHKSFTAPRTCAEPLRFGTTWVTGRWRE